MVCPLCYNFRTPRGALLLHVTISKWVWFVKMFYYKTSCAWLTTYFLNVFFVLLLIYFFIVLYFRQLPWLSKNVFLINLPTNCCVFMWMRLDVRWLFILKISSVFFFLPEAVVRKINSTFHHFRSISFHVRRHLPVVLLMHVGSGAV